MAAHQHNHLSIKNNGHFTFRKFSFEILFLPQNIINIYNLIKIEFLNVKKQNLM
jgi:hypothetical protein